MLLADLGDGVELAGGQTEPVISYLKSLYLFETDFKLNIWDENGEIIYHGPDLITFT